MVVKKVQMTLVTIGLSKISIPLVRSRGIVAVFAYCMKKLCCRHASGHLLTDLYTLLVMIDTANLFILILVSWPSFAWMDKSKSICGN